jgi:septal ring factor EnvC (AmiA/AmiB activator)
MNIFKLIHVWFGEHYSAATLKERLGLAKDQIAKLEKDISLLKAENESLKSQLQDCQVSLGKANQQIENRKKMNQFTPTAIDMHLDRPSRLDD